MTKYREILRLKHLGFSERNIDSFKPQEYSVKFAIISKDINKFKLPIPEQITP